MKKEETTLTLVAEVGTFGNMDMPDPTVTSIQELSETTDDEGLREYIKENLINGGNTK